MRSIIPTGFERQFDWELDHKIFALEGITLSPDGESWMREGYRFTPYYYTNELGAIQALIKKHNKQREFAAKFELHYLHRNLHSLQDGLTLLVDLTARQWCELFLLLF